MEVLAQALVSGACRHLETLEVSKARAGTGARLPQHSAVAAVLGGHAPCSRSLKVFITGIPMGNHDLLQLATALSEPTAVRLHVLAVQSRGPGIEGLVALLEALQRHAGGDLKQLYLAVALEDLEAADRCLSEALDRGCYPQLERVGVLTQEADGDESSSLRGVNSEAALDRRYEQRGMA